MVTIELGRLALMAVPVGVVLWIFWRWSLGAGNALYALGRMLLQLSLIGYLLLYIFQAKSGWIILGVLGVMLFFSSWIALRTVEDRRRSWFLIALASIALGGGVTLGFVTFGVLGLEPWYEPRYMIPLAGMLFANAMNSVSLAAERYLNERREGRSSPNARRQAMNAAMIPILNALFAVGLVSLPGMMTGQILSGVSPLVAARYQIMVMLMIFSASGLSAALFLRWVSARG
jgi:putative ABC transport system permease protein